MTQAIRWTPEQLAEYNSRANPKPQPVQYATGKAKGGYARADALSPDRRKEIAAQGAMARWANPGKPAAPTAYTCCRVPMTAKFRSKAEAEYAQMLEAWWAAGDMVSWKYESIRLRIGTDSWYKPDFSILTFAGKIEIIEVKGAYIREAGRLRLQAAARQYPEFSWRLAQKVKGAWTLEVVS